MYIQKMERVISTRHFDTFVDIFVENFGKAAGFTGGFCAAVLCFGTLSTGLEIFKNAFLPENSVKRRSPIQVSINVPSTGTAEVSKSTIPDDESEF